MHHSIVNCVLYIDLLVGILGTQVNNDLYLQFFLFLKFNPGNDSMKCKLSSCGSNFFSRLYCGGNVNLCPLFL